MGDGYAIVTWGLDLDRVLQACNMFYHFCVTIANFLLPGSTWGEHACDHFWIHQGAVNMHTIVSYVCHDDSNTLAIISNTHHNLSNTYPIVSEVQNDVTNTCIISNIHLNKLKGCKDAGGLNHVVKVPFVLWLLLSNLTAA